MNGPSVVTRHFCRVARFSTFPCPLLEGMESDDFEEEVLAVLKKACKVGLLQDCLPGFLALGHSYPQHGYATVLPESSDFAVNLPNQTI